MESSGINFVFVVLEEMFSDDFVGSLQICLELGFIKCYFLDYGWCVVLRWILQYVYVLVIWFIWGVVF